MKERDEVAEAREALVNASWHPTQVALFEALMWAIAASPQPSAPERPAEECAECNGTGIDDDNAPTFYCVVCNGKGSGSAPRENFECSTCGAKVSGLEKCPICHPVEGRADCADSGCELRGIWCDNCEKPQRHAAKSDPSVTSEVARPPSGGVPDPLPDVLPAGTRWNHGNDYGEFVDFARFRRDDGGYVGPGNCWAEDGKQIAFGALCFARSDAIGKPWPTPAEANPPVEAASEGSEPSDEYLARKWATTYGDWDGLSAAGRAILARGVGVGRAYERSLKDAGRASLAKRNALLEAFVEAAESAYSRMPEGYVLRGLLADLKRELGAAG